MTIAGWLLAPNVHGVRNGDMIATLHLNRILAE